MEHPHGCMCRVSASIQGQELMWFFSLLRDGSANAEREREREPQVHIQYLP